MQHNRRRNWQKRWFVLHQDKLAYFKDQTATDLKGLVLLAGPLAHHRPSPCTYRPLRCHGSICSHTRSRRSLARSTLHACFVWHVVATPSIATPSTSIARCTHSCAQRPNSRQLTHEYIMRHAVCRAPHACDSTAQHGMAWRSMGWCRLGYQRECGLRQGVLLLYPCGPTRPISGRGHRR